MPVAGGSIAPTVKYAYRDNDPDYLNQFPAVQNTWYEVFDEEDVRLLYCEIQQANGEVANKDVEVRWTIDGNVYFTTYDLPDSTDRYVYKNPDDSIGGSQGLSVSPAMWQAAYEADKRGQSFKVEVRVTSVPGTDQILRCRCVRESLVET